jgi:peptidoglycan/LPS O-acetylase OafA/YrhL
MERDGLAAPRRRRPHRRGYPALDGIRAVAVVAVLLYHFGVSGLRGGFLGVDVFFVLSGYLITGQLVTRWVLGGRIALGAFWVARARRLLPALGAVLVGSTTAVIVFDRGQLDLFRGDVAAAATYSSNWWYVFHQRSYFAAAGRPPVLQHLWSLAVEEQFYAIWPLVVAVVMAIWAGTRARLRVLLAISVAVGLGSSLVMGIGSAISHAPEAGDPSRWYFGTDSHVTGLMAGAALALARRGDGLGSETPTTPCAARPLHTWIGIGSLVALLVALSQTGQFSVWLYRWGFLAVSLLTMVVIAVATRPGVLATVLDRPILRAIGRRSYGLYLWHWPVACFTRPDLDLPISNGGAIALRLGLTLLLAEVSYQWIELPVRRLGWRSVWRDVSQARLGSFRAPTVIAVAVASLLAGVMLPASATPTEPHYASDGTVYVSRAGHPGSVHIQTPRRTPPPTRMPGSRHPVVAPHKTTPTAPMPRRRPAPKARSDLRHYDLAVYGDSVALGAIPRLAATFRSVTNDAEVGIQSWTLLPELSADADAGRLDGRIVLIHTGDNGVISRSQLRSALDALSAAARVVLTVPYVPRPWQDSNQRLVGSFAGDYRNVELMDWAGAVQAHPGNVGSDGIHLTATGERAYAAMVADAAAGH